MAASMLQNDVIRNFITDGDNSSISELAQGIICGDNKLLELVESLGPHLTDKNTSVRARGSLLLAEVLHQLPNNLLLAKEVELLCTFLCERLADHHSIQPPALYGLLALSNAANLPTDCVVQICEHIFLNVQNQTLSRQDRGSVYSILSNLLNSHTEVLKLRLGTNFVHGYIQVMDAEKDPRNLIQAFRCASQVINTFPLGVFIEEMFEVVACYFPIDFTPPEDDPHRITRGDLITGLRSCLAASTRFGQYCFPLLLEKLTSDVTSAKIDSLQTLATCAAVYDVKSLQEFQCSFFNCIKNEVLDSGNQKIEMSALEALKAIVSALSKFQVKLRSCCQVHLNSESLKYLPLTGRLLHSAAEGSEVASVFVLGHVMPKLITRYTACTQVRQRRVILEVMTDLIGICQNFTYTQSDSHPMQQHKGSVDSILMSALNESDPRLKLSAAKGISAIALLNNFQPDVEREALVTKILNFYLCEKDPLIRNEYRSVMSRLSNSNPAMIMQTVLLKLSSQLNTDPVADHQYLFEMFEAISTNMKLVSTVLEQLLLHMKNKMSDQNSAQRPEDFQLITKTLCNICSAAVQDDKCIGSDILLTSLLPELLRIFIEFSTSEHTLKSALFSDKVIDNLSAVVRNIVSHIDERNFKGIESTLMNSVISVFHDNGYSDSKKQTSLPFRPLLATSPEAQLSLVPVFTSIIASLPQQIAIPKTQEIMETLLELTMHCSQQRTSTAASMCMAAVINKHSELLFFSEKAVWNSNDWLKNVQQRLSCSLKEGEVTRKKAAMTLWVWLTKALVLRSHPMAVNFVTKLIELLSDGDMGSLAAEGFQTVLFECEDVLNKNTHAVIRIMYRQRFFVENVGKLVEGFNTSPTDTKKNYLLAISHLLKVLPKQVLLTELPPLFPLMVQSLLYEDKDLQLSTLNALYDLTHDAPKVVAQHVDSVIPQLLTLAKHKQNMKIRIAALKSLGVMTVLSDHVILPYKSQVTRTLEQVLDDHKRLVRNEAVLARGEWFLVGTAQKGKT
ncbi:hypothetical protein ScPMuIL_001682 [Solemya velum]